MYHTSHQSSIVSTTKVLVFNSVLSGPERAVISVLVRPLTDIDKGTVEPCETTRSTFLVVGLADTGGSVVAADSSGGGYLAEEDTTLEEVGQVKLIVWLQVVFSG
jgi:hypothetical protein